MSGHRQAHNPLLLSRSRQLRHEQGPPEGQLWRRLRAGQLDGFKFRRQYIIGRYIVDFCCPRCRLVVEVDGDSHVDQVEYDGRRSRDLAERGYSVIRFTNRDVVNNTEGVLEAILKECERRMAGAERDP